MAKIGKQMIQESYEKFKLEAEMKGFLDNFLFLSALRDLEVQINHMDELEKQIKADGPMVTKEYVKGRGNLYINPALNAYNKAVQVANNTRLLLIKIVNQIESSSKPDEEVDEL